MNKRHIIEKIRELDGLTKDEKNYLADIVNNNKQYGLVWENKPEKVEEYLETKLPILKEVKEKAIINDTENSNNPNHILIEGDNLHSLTTLTFTHENKIDIIYIDPPYNTGNKDFIYNDTFVDKEDTYKHSKWLSFMNKRLKIAKRLLNEKGVIFISIDDNEVAQLKILCDEIFGEQNFVGKWNWFKSATPPNLSHKIKKNIEYVLAYEKLKNNTKYKGVKKESKSDDPFTKPQNTIKKLTFPPNSINVKIKQDKTVKAGVYGTAKYPNKLLNDLIIKNGSNENEVTFENRFIWTQNKLDEELNNKTVINCSKNIVLSYKKADYSEEVPPNLINETVGVDTTEEAGKRLFEIFDKKVFDYPKPTSLIKYLLTFKPKKENQIILDFFAGTGTTAQAVFELNADDNLNRQCIIATNNENEICDEVTYPRIERILKPYKNKNGLKIPTYNKNNLRFFRTDYVERKPSLKNKKALTKLATELLCIRENCYYEITSQINKFKWNKLFTNKNNLYTYVVYNDNHIDEAVEELQNFIDNIENKPEIKVYVFSKGQYPYTEDFDEIKEYVELCALPDVIYKAYLNVLPKTAKL